MISSSTSATAFDHLRTGQLGGFFIIVRDRAFAHVGAVVGVIQFRVHADQINDAAEIVFRADRDLNRDGMRGQALLHHVHHALMKSAPMMSILLTYAMRGTLYVLACRQTVSLCGSTPPLAQNTATAPSSTRRATLDFDGEVDVAGRVDDVDLVIVPHGRWWRQK